MSTPSPLQAEPRPVGIFTAGLSGVYLALITALARRSGLDLLLFPELAALTTVVFSSPWHPWARSPWLLVLTPSLAGLVGVLITRQLPYGPVAVALVITATLLLIRALRSPVMPALSAGLLPLALGLHSWLYPLALLPGTVGLALVVLLRRQLFRRWRLQRWAVPAVAVDGQPLLGAAPVHGAAGDPVPGLPPLQLWLAPYGLFLAGALLLVRLLGSQLVLYPPLLVLAWETLARGDLCPWRGRMPAVAAVTAIAALIGWLLVQGLGPQPLATLLAVLLVALLLQRLQIVCPPAFAVALLPFVVQQPSASFPLHVLAGSSWLGLVAALHAAHRRRCAGRQWPQ